MHHPIQMKPADSENRNGKSHKIAQIAVDTTTTTIYTLSSDF